MKKIKFITEHNLKITGHNLTKLKFIFTRFILKGIGNTVDFSYKM